MQALIDPQVDAQAVDVLRFMARKVQARPLLHALLMSDIEHWGRISAAEKPRVFERDVRRFSVACPTLARKNKILHTAEGLRLAVLKAS